MIGMDANLVKQMVDQRFRLYTPLQPLWGESNIIFCVYAILLSVTFSDFALWDIFSLFPPIL